MVHAQVHPKIHPTAPHVAIAKSILTLASAKQRIPAELLLMLADNVLADGRIKLALTIKEGGDHVLDRAIELAELLIRETQEVSVAQEGGNHALLAS